MAGAARGSETPHAAAGGHEAPKPPAAAAPVPHAETPPARPAPPPAKSTRRLIVIDGQTGFAISGYDPVAYYVDSRPRPGNERFQFDWHGGAWLFVNEANMAVFRDRPEIYMPIYGGYCPFAVASGFPSEGTPLNWHVLGGRLHLFASAANRLAFLEGGAAMQARAEQRWPDVARGLP